MKKETPNRRKSARGSSTAGQLLLPMHSNKFALCLAAGVFSPWPKGVVISDQHTGAGGLKVHQDKVPMQDLLAAQGELSYGTVVVAVLSPEADRWRDAATGLAAAIPVDVLSYVVFRDEEARDDFFARAGSYSDISVDALEAKVDAKVFSPPTRQAMNASFELPIAVAEAEPSRANDHAKKIISAVDRRAGAVASALFALNAADSEALLKCAAPAFDLSIDSRSREFVRALMDSFDGRSRNEPMNNFFDIVLAHMGSGESDDSLDPAALLNAASTMLPTEGTAEDRQMMSKFLSFTADVINSRKDLPEGAFSDDDGSIALRGTLLFLLNPNADRLSSLRSKTRGLGPKVFSIASALAGFRQGYSSLDLTVKGTGSRRHVVARWALMSAVAPDRGDATSPAIETRFDYESGARCVALRWRDTDLASAISPCSAAVAQLAKDLQEKDWSTVFDTLNGDLVITGKKTEDTSRYTVRQVESGPIFPRSPCLLVAIKSRTAFNKKQGALAMAALNSTWPTSGIYGERSLGSKASPILLQAYVSLSGSADGVLAAMRALQETNERLDGFVGSGKAESSA